MGIESFNAFDVLSYPMSNTGTTMARSIENFSNEGSQKGGKCYFEIGFANTVNTSFNYTFFHLLYKHYVIFNS